MHTPPTGALRMTLGKVPWVIMLAPLLIITTIVDLSWRYAYNETVHDFARQVNAHIIEETSKHVEVLFESASTKVADLHHLFQTGMLDLRDTHAREQLFLNILRANRTFSWITLGFPNGDFFGTQHHRSGAYRSVTRTWDPTTKQAHGKDRFFLYEDSAFHFSYETATQLPYFAPDRAWYQSAVRTGHQVWTDVYIYSSSHKPGIDVAMPLEHNGQVVGVVAVGMELGKISAYLRTLSARQPGVVFLINHDAELIAYQDETEVVVTEQAGAPPQLGRLSAARSPWLRIAAQAVRHVPLKTIYTEIRFTVEADDPNLPASHAAKPYLVTLSPSGYMGWLTGTVIPMAVLVSKADAIQNNLLIFIALVTTVLGFVAYTLTRSLLIRPLAKIAGMRSRIGQGDLENTMADMVSPIVEIQHLAITTDTMKRDLHALRLRENQQAETRLEQERNLAQLNRTLQAVDELPEVFEIGLQWSIQTLQAHTGAAYCLDDAAQLQLTAGHAFHPGHPPESAFDLHNSWLGQALADNEIRVLHEIPPQAFPIRTGHVDLLPTTLVAIPIAHNARPLGILVIGSLTPFSEARHLLAKRAAQHVAMAVAAVQSTLHNRAWINQTLQQEKALRKNQ